MTIRVTIIASQVYDSYGILMPIGNTFNVSRDVGRALIQQRKAIDTDGALNQPNAVSHPDIVYLSAAEIANPTETQLANTLFVYKLNVAPYTEYKSNGQRLVMQPGYTGPKTVRGIGQGMSLAVQGFSGGTNVWSQTHRTRHYSNTRFQRFKVVMQCFYMTGSPIADTLFANDYNFQVGFEQNYATATTGLSPRLPITFNGGQTLAQYLVASPPSTGYIVSDWVELPSYVESKQFFGLWTTVEAAARTGSNLIPYTRLGSNFNQRFIGVIQAANTSQIDADSTFSATSVTATTSAQSGGSSYFSPCMMLIETDSTSNFCVTIGDSIGYGVGEGVNGSGAYGDTTGSALSNSGWSERAIYENLGYDNVNFSKGSDLASYFSNPTNWQYRKQLLTLANPTHIISGNVHNDISTNITLNGRVVSTAYNKYDVFLSNAKLYMNVVAGTTSSNSGGITTTGQAVLDGTSFWEFVQNANSPGSQAVQIYAWQSNMVGQFKAAVPTAKVIGMLPTPDASSTDQYLTTANQTASTNWGASNSRRGNIYTMMTTWMQRLGYWSLIDPNTALEADGLPNTTSKWFNNGFSPYLVTFDGTHPNSYGHYVQSFTLTADKFV